MAERDILIRFFVINKIATLQAKIVIFWHKGFKTNCYKDGIKLLDS